MEEHELRQGERKRNKGAITREKNPGVRRTVTNIKKKLVHSAYKRQKKNLYYQKNNNMLQRIQIDKCHKYKNII